jgi:hypothetical protein
LEVSVSERRETTKPVGGANTSSVLHRGALPVQTESRRPFVWKCQCWEVSVSKRRSDARRRLSLWVVQAPVLFCTCGRSSRQNRRRRCVWKSSEGATTPMGGASTSSVLHLRRPSRQNRGGGLEVSASDTETNVVVLSLYYHWYGVCTDGGLVLCAYQWYTCSTDVRSLVPARLCRALPSLPHTSSNNRLALLGHHHATQYSFRQESKRVGKSPPSAPTAPHRQDNQKFGHTTAVSFVDHKAAHSPRPPAPHLLPSAPSTPVFGLA